MLLPMVIYLPDLFVPALFGTWLDTLGEAAGYNRMFLFMGVCCVIAVVLAFTLAKKVKTIKDDEASEDTNKEAVV